MQWVDEPEAMLQSCKLMNSVNGARFPFQYLIRLLPEAGLRSINELTIGDPLPVLISTIHAILCAGWGLGGEELDLQPGVVTPNPQEFSLS